MPSPQILTNVIPARDQAVEIVSTAWGFGPDTPFHTGRPIVPETRLPHGVITLTEVPREQAVRNVSEEMAFDVVGYFPIPEGADLVALQTARARQAGEALLAYDWNSIDCYGPEVRNVTFHDADDPQPYFLVIVSFVVNSDTFQ